MENILTFMTYTQVSPYSLTQNSVSLEVQPFAEGTAFLTEETSLGDTKQPINTDLLSCEQS